MPPPPPNVNNCNVFFAFPNHEKDRNLKRQWAKEKRNKKAEINSKSSINIDIVGIKGEILDKYRYFIVFGTPSHHIPDLVPQKGVTDHTKNQNLAAGVVSGLRGDLGELYAKI